MYRTYRVVLGTQMSEAPSIRFSPRTNSWNWYSNFYSKIKYLPDERLFLTGTVHSLDFLSQKISKSLAKVHQVLFHPICPLLTKTALKYSI